MKEESGRVWTIRRLSGIRNSNAFWYNNFDFEEKFERYGMESKYFFNFSQDSSQMEV